MCRHMLQFKIQCKLAKMILINNPSVTFAKSFLFTEYYVVRDVNQYKRHIFKRDIYKQCISFFVTYMDM